jgi:hypothetical protein
MNITTYLISLYKYLSLNKYLQNSASNRVPNNELLNSSYRLYKVKSKKSLLKRDKIKLVS